MPRMIITDDEGTVLESSTFPDSSLREAMDYALSLDEEEE